jgi:proline iminopeptidase
VGIPTRLSDTRTREIRGVALFERRVSSGPPTVVLHGGPGAHHDYLLPGFDALARGRELIYYDQRGGGRSAVPRETPVGWREHVADLEALRQAWGLEQLTLAGYSWGGLLALLYATEHPKRVSRLALVSPAPAWREAR